MPLRDEVMSARVVLVRELRVDYCRSVTIGSIIEVKRRRGGLWYAFPFLSLPTVFAAFYVGIG